MKVRMRLVLPAATLLALAGCASTSPDTAQDAGLQRQTSAAPPQRVDAASNALGQRLDNMMANRRVAPASVTR